MLVVRLTELIVEPSIGIAGLCVGARDDEPAVERERRVVHQSLLYARVEMRSPAIEKIRSPYRMVATRTEAVAVGRDDIDVAEVRMGEPADRLRAYAGLCHEGEFEMAHGPNHQYQGFV